MATAPAIMAEDPAHGFLLLEDLGDDTFTRLLDSGVAAAGHRLAIDLCRYSLRNPVQIIPQGIATYDDDLFMTEVGLFLDWYLPAVLPDGLTVDAAQSFAVSGCGFCPARGMCPIRWCCGISMSTI